MGLYIYQLIEVCARENLKSYVFWNLFYFWYGFHFTFIRGANADNGETLCRDPLRFYFLDGTITAIVTVVFFICSLLIAWLLKNGG